MPVAALAKSSPKPPRNLVRATLSQAGRELIFTVRTAAPAPLGRLEAQPDTRRAGSHYLCLALARSGDSGERHLCLGGPKPRQRVGLVTVDGAGKPTDETMVAATVKRPNPRKLVLALVPGAAGLAPQRYAWRTLASHGCKRRNRCAEALPARKPLAFRLRPVRAVGCTGDGGLFSSGPEDRKVVALTFDDGPSDYTPSFLQVLREEHVDGTFFEIGQEMPGREATMRQILAEGNELGDHTMNHVELPDYAQIAGAAEQIAAYTHFRPCLFRPPGGAVNDGIVATAAGLGLQTINWNVDPADWTNPGSGTIYSTIVSTTRPGSIVLMHDGGGDRSETLAALPAVIDTLRGRGYSFKTVTDLLGNRTIYKPFG